MKKYILVIISVISIIYTIWYMHFGNIFKNSGAISKIGLNHPIFFAIWGLLVFISLSLNIIYAFYSFTNKKYYLIPLIISLIGMILTITCDFDYSKYTQYILHCFGSLTFSVLMSVTVFIIYLMQYKKSLYFKIMTIFIGIILISDLLLLIIYKETSLIEAFPIIFGTLSLLFTNLFIREKKLIEA